MLDEQTLESSYTHDEVKNLCRPLLLAPGAFDASALAGLPPDSWLSDVAAGVCGGFLSQVGRIMCVCVCVCVCVYI